MNQPYQDNILRNIFILLSTFVFFGCSTISPNKSNYSQTKLDDLSSGTRLVLCRPSSLFQAARRPDIYIDNQLATDIGSGEVIYINLLQKSKIDLRIELMGYGSQFTPGTKMILNAKPQLTNIENYFLLSVGLNNILPPKDNSSIGVISSEWSLRSINQKQFEEICGRIKITAYSPKF